MPPNLAAKIERAVQRILYLGGDRVRFIILYGSASSGRMKSDSDIDISVYYDADDAGGSQFRLKVLSDLFDDIYDIKIFQELPFPCARRYRRARSYTRMDPQIWKNR